MVKILKKILKNISNKGNSKITELQNDRLIGQKVRLIGQKVRLIGQKVRLTGQKIRLRVRRLD
jgi:hypothetical protein